LRWSPRGPAFRFELAQGYVDGPLAGTQTINGKIDTFADSDEIPRRLGRRVYIAHSQFARFAPKWPGSLRELAVET
jgi:hypothetical protein